jgi:NADP-dependent 3-hydroxy acid dehydrogenase YdfG
MTNSRVALVLGIGPGLGMSIAQRFGQEGFAVALVSRGAARHDAYVAELAARGVGAAAFPADVNDPAQLRTVLKEVTGRFGVPEVVYFGPGAADLDDRPVDITAIGPADVDKGFALVRPAVDAVSQLLPAMLERGSGGLLFAGGLSGKIPMPALGGLALGAAALRQYALTLHAALAPRGLYAGTLTIGGVVERGDIHAMISAAPATFGDLAGHTLDPDAIADVAWELYTARDRAEETFSAIG